MCVNSRDYDAYGNLLNMSVDAAGTSLLYNGEMFEVAIGQQYLRARWYDPTTGRFNRLDPFFGNLEDPQSLHKYLYVHGDPVNKIDPTGLISISPSIDRMIQGFVKRSGLQAGIAAAIRVMIGWRATYVLGDAYKEEVNSLNVDVNLQIARLTDRGLPDFATIGGKIIETFMMRPDIIDHHLKTVYEIKSWLEARQGLSEAQGYWWALRIRYLGEGYHLGDWTPRRNPYTPS